jgi:hypothetical protein
MPNIAYRKRHTAPHDALTYIKNPILFRNGVIVSQPIFSSRTVMRDGTYLSAVYIHCVAVTIFVCNLAWSAESVNH